MLTTTEMVIVQLLYGCNNVSEPARKTSATLADSPRGLSATLDALVQLEQPKLSPSAMTGSMGGFDTSMQQQAAMASAELKQKEEMFRQQQQFLSDQQRQQQVSDY